MHRPEKCTTLTTSTSIRTQEEPCGSRFRERHLCFEIPRHFRFQL